MSDVAAPPAPRPAGARYRSYRRYLHERFGRPVLKISLNAGFSCPNRDAGGGCTFCDNRGFSPAADAADAPVTQLARAISRARGRYEAFLPYLQPFSNTHGPVERLREVYESLIAVPGGVVGLAVGTRPDCFPAAIYDYLSDVHARTYLSVELGLQSSHDGTLRNVNRGHTFGDFMSCVEELARRGIETAAHVILGLPGETAAMMMATARRLADAPVAGVKIHQLMVFQGTPLAAAHARGEVAALDLDVYAGLVAEFLTHLRPDQHIHRLAADSRPERGLIAPLWSADKQAALREIRRVLDERDIRQGSARRLLPAPP